MYLINDDVARLCELLDVDEEIALIRPDGPGRWKAQRNVPTLRDGEYALWHIPSGPIELESTNVKAKPKKVKDAFAGWREIVKPFQRGVPWFGPGPLGIIRLRIHRKAGPAGRMFRSLTARPWSAPADDVIGLSSFSWIGNHYSIIGYRAAKATQRWWQSLRRRIAKEAKQIASAGPSNRGPKDAWAFPAALAQIRQGVRRADNP